jgi:RHS repeat-associated protein
MPDGYNWLYNEHGEIAAANHTSDTTKNRAYHFDGIGNRLWATEGNAPLVAIPTDPSPPPPAAARQTTYTANTLNQYTNITDTSSSSLSVPPTHDADGNLTYDGQKRYSWDAENRLVQVTDASTNAILVRYTYDAESRLIKRETGETTERYLYDGWNRIAEYPATGTSPLRTHLWGLDLSDTLQGAGGVGGLLSISENTTVQNFTYDSNGNVSEIINASTGELLAHYEYDSFGNTTVATGTRANSNVWRFSTKSFDDSSKLYYYGYRFYNPIFSRWLNRDPLDEMGGLNLYEFSQNAPLCYIDLLGLRWVDVYIWDWTWLGIGPGGRVGHVMITEAGTRTLILNQFPFNPDNANRQRTYDDTFAFEGSDPYSAFRIFIPNDSDFDRVAKDHEQRPQWAKRPEGPKETHCARSSYDALQAGGLPIAGQDTGQILPGTLHDLINGLLNGNAYVINRGGWSVIPLPKKYKITPITLPTVP